MKAFIKSLKRPGNETLIEAVLEGYAVIFESDITPTPDKYLHPKFSVGFVDKIFSSKEGDIVGNLGNFLKGEKTRAVFKEILETPIMVLNRPVQKGKAIKRDDIIFKGAMGTFNGKRTIFISNESSHVDIVNTILEEASHLMRSIRGRITKTDLNTVDPVEYRNDPDEVYAQKLINYIQSIDESVNKNKIDGYNIIFEDQIKGGKADKKKPSDVDPEQLKMGIKIEHEHTNDKKLAEEIAMDHLTEFPNYYTELKKMETKMEKENTPTDPEQVKMGDEVLERVFVYETLLDKNLRKKLFKRDVKSKKAILPDYTEVDEGKGYHTISYSKGSVVKGEILFVTESEMKMLDDWEDRYNRTEETLESGEKAWAYVEKKKYIKKDK